jgi:hypothetical protein
MTATYEVPITPGKPQQFSVTFPNGNTYQFRIIYQFNEDDSWLLDISDDQSNPIVCGIPLVTGVDLLGQYAYLGLGAKLWCSTDGGLAEPPHWWNLGRTAHLWLAG